MNMPIVMTGMGGAPLLDVLYEPSFSELYGGQIVLGVAAAAVAAGVLVFVLIRRGRRK